MKAHQQFVHDRWQGAERPGVWLYGYSFELEGFRVSITLIRDALGEGDLAQAKTLLGRDCSVCGRVAHGDKRGRQLGFPTANLEMFRKNTPLIGVFAVIMTGLDGRELKGVANLGNRLTFYGGAKAVLETHLFDFDQDIYGRYVEVHFKAKLRDEMRFDSFSALRAQIANDVTCAQAFLRLRKMTNIQETVPSPCVRNCCLNEQDICLGCFRSLEEICGWSQADNQQRQQILTRSAQRRMSSSRNSFNQG